MVLREQSSGKRGASSRFRREADSVEVHTYLESRGEKNHLAPCPNQLVKHHLATKADKH